MQAFHGIRVLDLTHVLAGPFSTYQLAVLGADVIKIESTTSFDMNREIGAVQRFSEDKMGTHFQSQAANKRGIALNLKTEEGLAIFRKLSSQADVIVENFRTGAMDRLGLSYDAIRKINPGIIYCSVTGFGHTGPKSEHAAFDNTIQAFSGMMQQNGPADDDAALVGLPVVDYGAGLLAAFAISSALFRRERTGKGQHLDVAMLDAALMLMTSSVLNVNTTGREPGRSRYARTPYAAYGGYHTSDDEVLMIGAVTPQHHKKLWRVLGREDLEAEMSGLRTTDMTRRSDQDELNIASALATKTASEWEELFIEAGLPAARVRTLNEALKSEQVHNRSVIGSFPSKIAKRGVLNPTMAGFVCSEDGPSITTAPPEHGEHTRSILQDIGYSLEAIDDLTERGVIG